MSFAVPDFKEIADRRRELCPPDEPDPVVPDGAAGRKRVELKAILSGDRWEYCVFKCELCPVLEKNEYCERDCDAVRATQDAADNVRVLCRR